MNDTERIRTIYETGTCDGNCISKNCPLRPCNCFGMSYFPERSFSALKWLESHGGTMNKNEAIKRLDAIEKEQAELRKIIEKGDKIVYDGSKIYVGVYNDKIYMMLVTKDTKSFVFYTLPGTHLGDTYSDSKPDGQKCLDYHSEAGFDIHVFDDTKEALQFFIDHL